jgi:hypothetical protein
VKLKKQDYYKVVGLLALADGHRRAMDDIIKAMVEIVGEKPDPAGSDYYGHVSDAVWSGYSADEMLARLAAQRKREAKRG